MLYTSLSSYIRHEHEQETTMAGSLLPTRSEVSLFCLFFFPSEYFSRVRFGCSAKIYEKVAHHFLRGPTLSVLGHVALESAAHGQFSIFICEDLKMLKERWIQVVDENTYYTEAPRNPPHTHIPRKMYDHNRFTTSSTILLATSFVAMLTI